MQIERCIACGSELILSNVVPDETAAIRGVEHHTFVCSECYITEHRVVFIEDGREADGLSMPIEAVRRVKRASPGLYGFARVMSADGGQAAINIAPR